MPLPDGFKLRITFFQSMTGATCLNVTHWLIAGGLFDNYKVIAEEMRDQFMPKVKPIQGNGVTWTGIKVESALPGAQDAYILPVTGTGTGGSSTLPNQCSILWTLLTGFAGRSKRGRFYVVGPSVNFVTGASLSSTGITQHNTAVTGLDARYGSGSATSGLRWALFSPKTGQWTGINGISVGQFVATQRRRKPGVGI